MKRPSAAFLALCAILLLFPVSPASAEPAAPARWSFASTAASTIVATQVVIGTDHLTGSVRIATLVATYFNRDVQEILALHADEIGFGMIAKALFTAVEANVSLEQILEMRLREIGWGEIRKELGLEPGMPHQSLGAVISQGRGPKGDDWVPPGQLKKQENNKQMGQSKAKGKP